MNTFTTRPFSHTQPAMTEERRMIQDFSELFSFDSEKVLYNLVAAGLFNNTEDWIARNSGYDFICSIRGTVLDSSTTSNAILSLLDRAEFTKAHYGLSSLWYLTSDHKEVWNSSNSRDVNEFRYANTNISDDLINRAFSSTTYNTFRHANLLMNPAYEMSWNLAPMMNTVVIVSPDGKPTPILGNSILESACLDRTILKYLLQNRYTMTLKKFLTKNKMMKQQELFCFLDSHLTHNWDDDYKYIVHQFHLVEDVNHQMSILASLYDSFPIEEIDALVKENIKDVKVDEYLTLSDCGDYSEVSSLFKIQILRHTLQERRGELDTLMDTFSFLAA